MGVVVGAGEGEVAKKCTRGRGAKFWEHQEWSSEASGHLGLLHFCHIILGFVTELSLKNKLMARKIVPIKTGS